MPTDDNIVVIDFSDAPAANSGGGSSALVPDAVYKFEVATASQAPNRNKKPMITITLRIIGGQHAGARIIERFNLVVNDDDSRFPIQRFNALLVACGFKEQTSRAAKIPLDRLIGKRCTAETVQQEQPATDRFEARTQSQILIFMPPAVGTADEKAQPETESESEPELETEPTPAQKPAKKAVSAAKAEPELEPSDDMDDDGPTTEAEGAGGLFEDL